jgi:hypothetical protein
VIVWLASYPRSGNTFLRIIMNRLYGVRSSTVYDFDGVARRLGDDLVGFADDDTPFDEMRASDRVHLVKTHNPLDERVDDADAAICLVRDGRDSLVSWARQRTEDAPDRFEDELRNLIALPQARGAGQWGTNVLTWLGPSTGRRVLVHFEHLIERPEGVVSAAMETVIPGATLSSDAIVPSFSELHAVDDRFFRRGVSGTHRDEMRQDLEEAFWAQTDNRVAMSRLGYR